MTITDFLDIPPDIVKAEKEYPHGNGNVLRVFSPGNSVWGSKVEGTFTVVYECVCDNREPHEHQALYGPEVIQFDDACSTCKKHKWTSHEGHEYTPCGVEILDPKHLVLYAD